LALHPHADAFDQGGDEVAGQHGRREHHYGLALAARGFSVLCPDLPCFGQQQSATGMPGRSWEDLCLMRALAHGRSLLSESVDQLRNAVAALLDYEGTADLTVSALGFGLGARMAAWIAFADQRVGAVWMHAGLGQHRILLAQGRVLPKHVVLPGLLAHGIDQADIVADLLPRAVGISYGRQDHVATPEAIRPVLTALRERAAGFPNCRCEIVEGDYDHRFPAEVLAKAGDCLLAWAG
jgi:dienelactone hydrolase